MPRLVLEQPFRHRVGLLLVAVLVTFADGTRAQTDDGRPRLLIVVESDSRLPFAKLMLQGIEAELGPEFTTRSEIYVEYLDMLRFNNPQELALKRTFLVKRFGGLGLDAIGVLGNNALAFVADHRDAIAPGAPIVYGALGEAGLKGALAGRTVPELTGVISPFDLRSTLDLALKVQPDAPEIVIVVGSALFDQQWRSAAEETIGEDYGGRPVRLLPETTAEAYLAEARAFDPGAIVLLLSLNFDSAGRRFLPVQFAKALAEASPAPVWVMYESQIGTGAVGGNVDIAAASGAQMGAMLRTAISGAPLPEPVRVSGEPTVDWRAMRRHELNLSRLPEGSRILFYEPTLWEENRLLLLTIATVVLAQTATIAALLFHRRRYFTTRKSLESERLQLIHISRNLRLGQLSASLAHEINQPLAAILANAEAGSRLSGRTPPDLEEIAAIFRDITDDVRRAGTTIAGLRRLMVKGEVAMERLDLNEIVRDTITLVQNELAASGAQVRQVLSADPVEVTANGPQLQQIVLNLVLNASEAMEDLPEAARIVRVTTAALSGGGVELTVEDAGPGVPPDRRDAVFRPFVSSKPSGLGVGLAICRSIAEAHGGSLGFVGPSGASARIVLTLPSTRAKA